jgi:hypothetical protein
MFCVLDQTTKLHVNRCYRFCDIWGEGIPTKLPLLSAMKISKKQKKISKTIHNLEEGIFLPL